MTGFDLFDRISAMLFQRVRPVLSFGLLGCVTMALVPLGCGATVRQLAQQDDRPRVPDATAERLRACVDELGGELRGGYYTFDVTVKVDEDGHVADVESKGVPHTELATCMRNSPTQSQWGDIDGSSRCMWCWRKCNKEYGWPDYVRGTDGKFQTCVYKPN